MRYNLFLKEEATSWEVAKTKHIKSAILNEERIKKDYKKAFPYIYNPDKHFVYEGELTVPYRITKSLEIIFYTDKESVEARYKVLGAGEVLEGDEIKIIPSPGAFHAWEYSKWEYKVELERQHLSSSIEQAERELEQLQAQIDSRERLGMYTIALEVKNESLLDSHCDLCQKLAML